MFETSLSGLQLQQGVVVPQTYSLVKTYHSLKGVLFLFKALYSSLTDSNLWPQLLSATLITLQPVATFHFTKRPPSSLPVQVRFLLAGLFQLRGSKRDKEIPWTAFQRPRRLRLLTVGHNRAGRRMQTFLLWDQPRFPRGAPTEPNTTGKHHGQKFQPDMLLDRAAISSPAFLPCFLQPSVAVHRDTPQCCSSQIRAGGSDCMIETCQTTVFYAGRDSLKEPWCSYPATYTLL